MKVMVPLAFMKVRTPSSLNRSRLAGGGDITDSSGNVLPIVIPARGNADKVLMAFLRFIEMIFTVLRPHQMGAGFIKARLLYQ